jgi:hypothetical protein
MNKKLNTVLFLLGATIFNVLVATISFILLSVLYTNLIVSAIPEEGRVWGFIIVFLSALAVSFFAYRFALKFLMTKINLEKYFDPLFISSTIKKY